jgi:predicted acyltransferase (DUF342 family)
MSCDLTLDDGPATSPVQWEIHCGGVFSTAAASTVVFANTNNGGSTSDDVSWVIGGTTTTGAGSTVIGNLYSVGAIVFGADTTWTGALFSLTGAVTLGAGAKSGGITTGGAITLGASAQSGNLVSTSGGAVTLGAAAESGTIIHLAGGAQTLGAGATKDNVNSAPQVPAVPATEFMGDLCSLPLPLLPGIYHTAAACVVSCMLTLDNGSDVDPNWEIQCGGALSTAVDSGVVFTAAGDTEDVIWNIGGATATGAGSEMIGVLNSVGAIITGADSRWTGDVTSSAGAIGTGARSRLIGTTQAEGAIAVGAHGQTGDVTSISGAIALGAFAQSDATSAAGGVTLGDGAVDGVDQFSPTTSPSSFPTGVPSSSPIATPSSSPIASPSSSPSRGPSQAPGGPPQTFSGNLCSLGSDLAPGVYISAAACTLACKLNLQGSNDPAQKWHFHCGGALSTAADSEVTITNGIADEVHWDIAAATATGAGSLMVGNLDAVGAIILGAATEWTGDLTSSNGGVGTGAGSKVMGNVRAYGAITLGAGATSENLTSTNGAVYLGANAVAEVCAAESGAGVTYGAGATITQIVTRRLLRRAVA